jgi:phage tail sheath protein FI
MRTAPTAAGNVLHRVWSIEQRTAWTVHEPYDKRLSRKLREAVPHFLDRGWRAGALAGEMANDAYYVKCNAETNPR